MESRDNWATLCLQRQVAMLCLQCTLWAKEEEPAVCLPCIVLLVSRNIIVGGSQSSLRWSLQMPIVDAVQEHFCQLNYCLPFFGWQVTKFVLYKVIHTLKRRKGNLFTQLYNPEHSHSQPRWWSLAKEKTFLYSQKPLPFPS